MFTTPTCSHSVTLCSLRLRRPPDADTWQRVACTTIVSSLRAVRVVSAKVRCRHKGVHHPHNSLGHKVSHLQKSSCHRFWTPPHLSVLDYSPIHAVPVSVVGETVPTGAYYMSLPSSVCICTVKLQCTWSKVFKFSLLKICICPCLRHHQLCQLLHVNFQQSAWWQMVLYLAHQTPPKAANALQPQHSMPLSLPSQPVVITSLVHGGMSSKSQLRTTIFTVEWEW